MSWFLKFLGWPEMPEVQETGTSIEVVPAEAAVVAQHPAATMNELDAQVSRFTVALEQHEGGEEHKAELQKWLAYYAGLRNAVSAHPVSGD